MQARRLRITGIVAFCTLVIVYTCFLGYLDIRDFEKTIIAQTESHLSALAQTHAEKTKLFIWDIKGELEILAQDPRVRGAIVDDEFHDKHSHESKYCPYEPLYNHLVDCVECLLRVDSEGRVQGTVPFEEGLVGADYSNRPGVWCVMKHLKPCVSDVFYSHSGRKCVAVAYPVFKEEEFVGVVEAYVVLDKMHAQMNRVRIGQNGYMWIMDGAGTIISHPDRERIASFILDGDESSDKVPGWEQQQIVSEMLSGRSGSASTSFEKYVKGRALIAWSPVDIAGDSCKPWIAVVCMGYDEISGPVRAHSRNILIVVTCLVSAFVLAGFLYYKAETKRAQFESYKAIDRVNRELQFMSAERDSTTAELREQLETARNVIRSIPYSIFWKDRHSVYQGCNKQFAKVMGIGRCEEIAGKTDYDLTWNAKRADFAVKCDKEVMKTGVPLLDVEERQYTSDGRIIHLLCNKIPLRDTNGRITGVLGIQIDITKLKSSQVSAFPESSALRETISAMQEGVVIIDGSGKVTEANPYFQEVIGRDSDEVVGKGIFGIIPGSAGKYIRDGVKHFKESMVSEPMVFEQKIREGSFSIRVQPIYCDDKYTGAVLNMIDITQLAETRQQLQSANGEKDRFIAKAGHAIRTPMSNIIGFSELLKQEELTSQQVEFVDKIHISANDLLEVIEGMLNRSKMEFSVPEKEQVKSNGEVRDDELGSEESDEEHVKEDGLDAVGDGGGSGVEAENGVCEEKKASAAEQAEDSSESDSEAHILIVDDIVENRMLIDILLKKAGYETSLCGNGKEAVELAERHKYDLIIMDVHMPVMDGFEATKIIKSCGLNSDTSILAITASMEGDANAACLEAGCSDCVSKPIKKERLLRKVWRLVQQKKQIESVAKGGDIISFLYDDPDYQKTIEMFVNNLPGRIKEMQEAFDKGDLEELSSKVHALKGLGGFAGFSVYTERAKELEQTIRNEQIESIKQQLDEMSRLCLRTKLARR
jgi:PAS domain S-box-containing protein